MQEELLQPDAPKRTWRFKKRYVVFLVLLLLLARFYVVAISAPKDFPSGEIVTIDENKVLSEIAQYLKDKNIIRTPAVFNFFVILYGGEKRIAPGDYTFSRPLSAIGVAKALVARLHGVDSIKVTLPEGYTREDMARTFSPVLKNFSTTAFLEQTKNDEGYLFPDTYFFFPTTTTEQVISKLKSTFEKKIDPLRPEIEKSGKGMNSIIIMASIIEKEAMGDSDRAIVSGILWNRLNKGMPLQVDATLGYVTGKSSSELTVNDLKSDSLYNTYTHKGLPPGPISNPGIAAIGAAIHPDISPYLYYLHDKNGVIHFARTFAEHKQNIAKYLSR